MPFECGRSLWEIWFTDWAKENNKKLYKLLVDDEEYAKAIFAIEAMETQNRVKDISGLDRR